MAQKSSLKWARLKNNVDLLWPPLPLIIFLSISRFVEAVKFGFAKRTEMGDWNYPPIRLDYKFDPFVWFNFKKYYFSDEVTKIVMNLTSQSYIDDVVSKIDDSKTYLDPRHYGAEASLTEDHGTCQHSFMAPDGSAVSVTATVNLLWGCKFMSPSTGIIMNSQMDDFGSPNITSAYDVPPSPNNYIFPGKRPMSSISTTIVTDHEGRVRAVAGASGGTKIITATAQVLLRALYLGQVDSFTYI